MRFLIVATNTAEGNYQGMDRPRLGMLDDVPPSLVQRGIALEDLLPGATDSQRRQLVEEIRQLGARYEILALGNPHDSDYELLGYDVGEKSPRAWSALAHREEVPGLAEAATWNALLNQHGLFPDRSAAERFLARYLESDDPDMNWGAEGWEEQQDLYDLVPIYRLKSVRDGSQS